MWRSLWQARPAWPLVLCACAASQPELVLEARSHTRAEASAPASRHTRVLVFTAAFAFPIDAAGDTSHVDLAATAETFELGAAPSTYDACVATGDPLCAWAQAAEAAVWSLVISSKEHSP